jgi:carbon monoxide dehydrogenase subunit G
MKIEGSADIPAARDRVWAAFLDPNILAQALPGCEKLEAIGENEYKATMKVGVAAIKGTFDGKVKLSDLEPPHRYRMAVEGSGGPGFVRGDAQVGGLIASVGQRMLGGVSKMMLDQFFGRMTDLLTAQKT